MTLSLTKEDYEIATVYIPSVSVSVRSLQYHAVADQSFHNTQKEAKEKRKKGDKD